MSSGYSSIPDSKDFGMIKDHSIPNGLEHIDRSLKHQRMLHAPTVSNPGQFHGALDRNVKIITSHSHSLKIPHTVSNQSIRLYYSRIVPNVKWFFESFWI